MSKLNRNGPEFSEFLQMSAFRVKGFMKGGWPVVIDYDARPGTYRIEVGLYDFDGTRLKVSSGADALTLANVQVK